MGVLRLRVIIHSNWSYLISVSLCKCWWKLDRKSWKNDDNDVTRNEPFTQRKNSIKINGGVWKASKLHKNEAASLFERTVCEFALNMWDNVAYLSSTFSILSYKFILFAI